MHCCSGRSKYVSGEKRRTVRVVACKCCSPPRQIKVGARAAHRNAGERKRDKAFAERMAASLSGPVSGMEAMV